MPITPNNPPNQVTNADAAIPTALVQDGAFVGALNPLVIASSGSTQAVVTTLYECVNLFVDPNGTVNDGDILQNIVIYNSSGVETNNIWNDLTQGFQLADPAPAGDVQAYVAGGAATAANQTLEIGLLTDISAQLPPALGLQAEADSLSVVVANGLTGDISAASLFVATAADTGYSIGDVIQSIAVYTPGTPNVLVSTTWNNLTTGLELAAAPPAADLSPIAGGGSSTADTSTTALYYVVSADTGYSVNDVIQEVVILDPSTVPATVVSTEYNNLTQGTRNITIATQTDIVPIGTPGSAATNVLNFDSNYTAVTTVAGEFNQGDVLAKYLVLDPTTLPNPTEVSETWYNLNQQTTLSIIPTNLQVVPVVGSNLNTTATYYATIANPGNYAVGDVLQQDVIVNPVAVPPAVLSTTYNNLTTGAQNVSVVLSDLVPTDAPGVNVSSDAPVVSFYAANTAGTGYSVGDTIQKVEIVNPATAAVVSTTWNNLTTDTVLGTAPTITDLTASQSQLPPALGIQTSGNSLSVWVANPSTNTTFPVTSQFTVSTAFVSPAPGGAIGDLVQLLQIYDTSVTPAVITTTVWSNLTTNVVYPSAVSFSDLTPVTSTALTDAELRAAPVPVFSNTESTFMYTVSTAFTGASVGDILARVITYQATSTVPTQLDETWYNLSTGLTLGSAPSYSDVTASASSTVTPSLPAVTASVTVETGAGTTASGATSVSFANNGAGNATVAGAILPPAASLDFTANAGSTINAISFDGTGTSLLVAILA